VTKQSLLVAIEHAALAGCVTLLTTFGHALTTSSFGFWGLAAGLVALAAAKLLRAVDRTLTGGKPAK
jgi:hypothetical protein